MAVTERITMTMRDLDRHKVIKDVADGLLKPWRAAERLGLSTRQIRRLVTATLEKRTFQLSLDISDMTFQVASLT